MRQPNSLWKRIGLVLLFCVGYAFAGENRWTSHGPDEARVTKLIVHPSERATVYAATYDGGIYRSIDRGENWTAINVGMFHMTSLAIDPSEPATLYAGSAWGTIFKSVDGGSSWTPVGGDFGGSAINQLIIDPADHLTLYALTGFGVFKSNDGGKRWIALAGGLPANNLFALAIDTQQPNRLLAGTSTGLFVTTDGGRRWTPMSVPSQSIHAIAIDPSSSQNIYLSVEGSLLATTDGGQTWKSTGNSYGVDQFLVDPTRPGVVFAATTGGILKSMNYGESWTSLPALASSIVALAHDSMGSLYAGGVSHGVFRSTDDGASWSLTKLGLKVAYVNSVAIDPSNPSVIFAGTESGVFKTVDGGEEWRSLNSGLTRAEAVTIDPINPKTVYAVSNQGGGKTTDGGETWTRIQPNLSGSQVRDLIVDPSDSSKLYAALVDRGISKSTDGGASWGFSGSGLGPAFYGPYVFSLADDSTRPATLFAGTDSGVFKSLDAGGFWFLVKEGLGATTTSLAIDPVTPSIVYAASTGGLFRTADGGNHWMLAQAGIATKYFYDLAIDPSDSSTVYAATDDRGIFRSSDRGETWSEFNTGLPPAPVLSIAIDSSGRFLVAGTTSGVFTYEIVAGLPLQLSPARLPDDATRLPHLLDQLREMSPAPGLLIAAAGDVRGINGTHFRSDVTLANRDAAPQDVLVAWLAAGFDGTNAPAFRLTLPSEAVTIADFVDRMGFSGLGSLIVIAIDAAGKPDSSASIDAFSRIYTAGPNGMGTFSQSFNALPIEALGGRAAASSIGLRQDLGFRTNVGIVNLDTKSQTFSIELVGERKSSTLALTVEPLSMRQVPIPEGDYGAVMAVFRAGGAGFFWSAYGTSVDNVTGDGWVAQAAALP